jgi:hypothetical protein
LNDQRRPEEKRHFLWEYEVTEQGTKKKLPIQLVVSLPANSDHQMLELEWELTDLGQDLSDRVTIEQLELWLPNEMGIIVRQEPEGYRTINDSPGGDQSALWQKIQWKELRFQRRQISGEAPRLSIFIQFQKAFDNNVRLFGHMKLRVPSAKSGLNRVDVCTPFGGKRDQRVDFEAFTIYDIALDLNISCLRYQQLQTFSPPMDEKQGIVPDTKFITNVTDRLSREGFYIKRIIENPSRTSKEGAHKINRFWDIIGRKYEDIYPIDFHFVVIGEEVTRQSSENVQGKLKVIINVHGLVTNDRMKKQIEVVGNRLKGLIEKIME